MIVGYWIDSTNLTPTYAMQTQLDLRLDLFVDSPNFDLFSFKDTTIISEGL